MILEHFAGSVSEEEEHSVAAPDSIEDSLAIVVETGCFVGCWYLMVADYWDRWKEEESLFAEEEQKLLWE